MKFETIREIISIQQVVNEKNVKYKTKISSSEVAKNLGIEEIGFEAQETVLVLALNSQSQINAMYRAFKGTVTSSIIHPREIFRTAMMNNASRVMIFHNHPSLDEIRPSEADIQSTNNLIKAGEILGIELLDHIIVSGNNAYSLKENGYF